MQNAKSHLYFAESPRLFFNLSSELFWWVVRPDWSQSCRIWHTYQTYQKVIAQLQKPTFLCDWFYVFYPSDKGNNWPPLRTIQERKLLITTSQALKKKMMMRTANQARNGESPAILEDQRKKESIVLIKNASKMRIVMIPFSNCVLLVTVLPRIAQVIQIVHADPNVTLKPTSVEVILNHFKESNTFSLGKFS